MGAILGAALIISPAFLRCDNRLKISFLDVGQGDSVLIKTPGGQVILIDGGPDNKVLWELGESLPFYRRRIDFLVLSHYHDDHLVGLIEVIKRHRVGTLIYSGKDADSLLIAELLEVVSQNKVALRALDGQARLSFGVDCFLNLLNPDILGIKEDPNNSLVSRLDCNGRRLLSSGDNNEAVEKALLGSGWPLEADIFKASHHGSDTSNSLDFLERIDPRLVVIPVGRDNRFGHPSPGILERIEDFGIRIKRTDQDGRVVIYE